MKTKSLVLAATLLGGLFVSTRALAQTAPATFVAPAPAKVVSPVDLPNSLKGTTVTLQMTIDAAGQAHDIKVMSSGDRAATRNLVSAVSRWQFTPARFNGVPVSTKVTLPIVLQEG